MTHRNSHTIIRTFFDKHGHLESRATGVVGGTYEDAYHHYQGIVAACTQRPRVVGVILIDHEEVVLAEWNANVKEAA